MVPEPNFFLTKDLYQLANMELPLDTKGGNPSEESDGLHDATMIYMNPLKTQMMNRNHPTREI